MKKSSPFDLLFPALLALSVALIVGGGFLSSVDHLTIGVALLAGGIAGLFIALAGMALHALLRDATRHTSQHQASVVAGLTEQINALSAQVSALADQELLSDRAKTLAFSDRNRDMVLRAFREAVERGNFSGAQSLIQEVEALGNTAGAASLREELGGSRLNALRQELEKAKERIARYAGIEDWTSAFQEAAKFNADYPQFTEGRTLVQDIEKRRTALRDHLLERWHEAVANRNDEAGVALLKRLDTYLTPSEAEKIADDARTMVSERRNKMRDSFAAAVARQEWAEAIRVAEVIQVEFPNSKFAQEIKSSMDGLRERANDASTEIFTT